MFVITLSISHQRAWNELWDDCKIRVPDDNRVQFLLRYHSEVIRVKIALDDGHLHVGAEFDSLNRSVKLGVGNQVREIRAGESYTFDLSEESG